MTIVTITYEMRDGLRKFLRQLPKVLGEELGTSEMILECKPIGEFDIIKGNIQIYLVLHPTEDRLKLGPDKIAQNIANKFNKDSFLTHYVLVNLGGNIGYSR